MKFLVNDSQSDRHAKIRSFLTADEAVIAVLLAAVDFEWTLRRAICALGNISPKDLSSKRISGLDGYRRAWKAAVANRASVEFNQLIDDWDELNRAYLLRHELIHGTHGTTGLSYATRKVDRILDASTRVFEFAQEQGVNLYARLPARRRPISRPATGTKRTRLRSR